jgi:hypothetical protein
MNILRYVLLGLVPIFTLSLSAQTWTSFNGDSYADIAIASMGEDITKIDEGFVNVLYGQARLGFNSEGNEGWSQSSLDETPLKYDHFSSALAIGDFNADGYADLVVGAPNKPIGTSVAAGVFYVIYGTSDGLKKEHHQRISRLNMHLANHDYLNFGKVFAVGDFNGDEFDDLAIGVSGDDTRDGIIQDRSRSGSVQVLYGSFGGLSFHNYDYWSQDTGNIDGISEDNDFFADALASGDFNNDGFDDLAVGVPHEEINSIKGAGCVNIIFGSKNGLTDNSTLLLDQTIVPGDNRSEDAGFGSALASGDINGDGFDDLVIGTPWDNVWSSSLNKIVDLAGSITIVLGTSNGFDFARCISQDNISNALPEYDDDFGHVLAMGDLNGDGFDEIVIGAPEEDINDIHDAGAINILSPVVEEGKIKRYNSQTIYQGQSNPSIEGSTETDDGFGTAIAIGNINNDSCEDIIIGVPHEDINGTSNAGVVNVIFGGAFPLDGAWNYMIHQNSTNIVGYNEDEDNFGFAVVANRVVKRKKTRPISALYYLLLN